MDEIGQERIYADGDSGSFECSAMGSGGNLYRPGDWNLGRCLGVPRRFE